jgi:hypothetical protein
MNAPFGEDPTLYLISILEWDVMAATDMSKAFQSFLPSKAQNSFPLIECPFVPQLSLLSSETLCRSAFVMPYPEWPNRYTLDDVAERVSLIRSL